MLESKELKTTFDRVEDTYRQLVIGLLISGGVGLLLGLFSEGIGFFFFIAGSAIAAQVAFSLQENIHCTQCRYPITKTSGTIIPKLRIYDIKRCSQCGANLKEQLLKDSQISEQEY